MATSRLKLREKLKLDYLSKVIALFEKDEQVLRVGTNEIAFPVVDSEGNEDFIVIVVKVPTGSREDKEPYDGFAMAEQYEIKQRDKAEKAIAKAEAKEKKIARDKAYREAKAKQKENRGA